MANRNIRPKRQNLSDFSVALRDVWRDIKAGQRAGLYKAIENGIVELDQDLKNRVGALKNEKVLSVATIDRLRATSRAEV